MSDRESDVVKLPSPKESFTTPPLNLHEKKTAIISAAETSRHSADFEKYSIFVEKDDSIAKELISIPPSQHQRSASIRRSLQLFTENPTPSPGSTSSPDLSGTVHDEDGYLPFKKRRKIGQQTHLQKPDVSDVGDVTSMAPQHSYMSRTSMTETSKASVGAPVMTPVDCISYPATPMLSILEICPATLNQRPLVLYQSPQQHTTTIYQTPPQIIPYLGPQQLSPPSTSSSINIRGGYLTPSRRHSNDFIWNLNLTASSPASHVQNHSQQSSSIYAIPQPNPSVINHQLHNQHIGLLGIPESIPQLNPNHYNLNPECCYNYIQNSRLNLLAKQSIIDDIYQDKRQNPDSSGTMTHDHQSPKNRRSSNRLKTNVSTANETVTTSSVTIANQRITRGTTATTKKSSSKSTTNIRTSSTHYKKLKN